MPASLLRMLPFLAWLPKLTPETLRVDAVAFAPQIQNGIFAGILVSLGLFIYRRMRPNLAVVEPSSAQLARAAPEDTPESLRGAVGVVHFDASLVFVNVSYFEDAVLRLEPRYPQLRFVLVSASGINDLDASGVETLTSLCDGLRKNGIELLFSAVKPRVRAVLDRTGLTERIGAENFFLGDYAAFAALAARIEQSPAAPDGAGEA